MLAEIIVLIILLLILAVLLFWKGPDLLSWVVDLGEAIEEKVAEWRQIFRALRNGED